MHLQDLAINEDDYPAIWPRIFRMVKIWSIEFLIFVERFFIHLFCLLSRQLAGCSSKADRQMPTVSRWRNLSVRYRPALRCVRSSNGCHLYRFPTGVDDGHQGTQHGMCSIRRTFFSFFLPWFFFASSLHHQVDVEEEDPHQWLGDIDFLHEGHMDGYSRVHLFFLTKILLLSTYLIVADRETENEHKANSPRIPPIRCVLRRMRYHLVRNKA